MMNRLQKKCLLAATALHALLCLVLVVGPAFLRSKPKAEDDLPALEVIPDKVIDAPFYGGGNPKAKPEPPAPQVQQPQAQESKPVEHTPPPRSVTRPLPEPETVRKPEREVEPAEVKPKRTKPDIKVDDTIVKRSLEKTAEKPKVKVQDDSSLDTAKAETVARRRTAQRILAQLNGASRRLDENLSPGTTIEPLGPGGEAYANYAQVVKSYYDRAWIDPEDVSDNSATVKVKVVIARDGAVISADIIDRSGVSALDKSVQNALDRVRQLPAFPAGATESQRTFNISFNLKAKRLAG